MKIGKMPGLFLLAVCVAGILRVQAAAGEARQPEPDPSVPLKVTAIDYGWDGWGEDAKTFHKLDMEDPVEYYLREIAGEEER